jgi:hypothetical protein
LLSRPRMHMGAITRAQMIKMTHQCSAIHEKPAAREFVMGESHLGICLEQNTRPTVRVRRLQK